LNEKSIRLVLIAVTIAVATGLSAVVINQSGEMSNLNQKVLSLESERIDLVAKLTQLARELVDAKANVSGLSQILKSRDADISSLRRDLAAAGSNIELLKQKSAEADSEISRLKSEVATYLERIRVLTLPVDQRHLNASRLTQADCLSCHVKTVRLAQANESNLYHNMHLNQRLLNFTCTDCHKQVDMSTVQKELSKLVDTSLCIRCHRPFPEKEAMGVIYKGDSWLKAYPDCTRSRCHDDWKSQMAKARFIKISLLTDNDCPICHAPKTVLFDMKPESIRIPCSVCHGG